MDKTDIVIEKINIRTFLCNRLHRPQNFLIEFVQIGAEHQLHIGVHHGGALLACDNMVHELIKGKLHLVLDILRNGGGDDAATKIFLNALIGIEGDEGKRTSRFFKKTATGERKTACDVDALGLRRA